MRICLKEIVLDLENERSMAMEITNSSSAKPNIGSLTQEDHKLYGSMQLFEPMEFSSLAV